MTKHEVYIVPHFIGREIVKEEASEFYSHCVGPGWNKHLVELTDKLFILGWTGGLTQVKEKFGTLRFYWRNDVPAPYEEIAEDVVAHYEAMTAYICEECGGPGELQGTGWVVTLCKECFDKREAKRAELRR